MTKGSLLWRLREWLLFRCPPHRFGPLRESGIGLGRQCAKCRLWEWAPTLAPASAKPEQDEHVCDPENPECRAHLFYSDPENRRASGHGRRQERVTIPLSSGARATVSRQFLGGVPSTTNSSRHRVTTTWSGLPPST
jgi:hypothetical protein